MSAWKVILATLVIFIAGLVTGAVGVRQLMKPTPLQPPGELPMLPEFLRKEYVRHMEAELDLTPRQRAEIAKIVQESQERTRELFDLVQPEWREELRYARSAIRQQLNPEQAGRFDAMLRRRQRRLADKPPPDSPRRFPGAGQVKPGNEPPR